MNEFVLLHHGSLLGMTDETEELEEEGERQPVKASSPHSMGDWEREKMRK